MTLIMHQEIITRFNSLKEKQLAIDITRGSFMIFFMYKYKKTIEYHTYFTNIGLKIKSDLNQCGGWVFLSPVRTFWFFSVVLWQVYGN